MFLIVAMPSSEMRCLNTPSSRASLSPTDPRRSADSAAPKSTVIAARPERHADEPDPRSARHPGDVGDGEDLGGGAVEPGAGRADPDGDRDRRVGDALEQRLHLVAADDGTTGVDLQHEGLRSVGVGALDGLVDGVDDDGIDQPADLEHVDGSGRGRRFVGGVGRCGERQRARDAQQARQ